VEKFPDVQTAWDEFLDPEGVGNLTKATLMHAVQALGLAGFVKGIPGDVRGFVRDLMKLKESKGELLLLGDLTAFEPPDQRNNVMDDPRSDPTAKSDAGASMMYGTVDDYTVADYATLKEGTGSIEGEPVTPDLAPEEAYSDATKVYSDADQVFDAQEYSSELAHNAIRGSILSQSMPDLGLASME
jgi:hypothetical protein